MNTIVHSETKEFHRNVDDDTAHSLSSVWLINPDLSEVIGAPKRCWIIVDGKISLDKLAYDRWQKRMYRADFRKGRNPKRPKMKTWFWQRWFS